MHLPVRILRPDEPPPRHPVIAVDGHVGAPGLELSHWPGHATPDDLRHDLSTGCALAFARLGTDERRTRAAGAREIVNNHYDTDGTCSLFAVRHPEPALGLAEALLSAARAGDFFEVPSEEAFCLDQAIGGATDPDRSPLGAALAGADDARRWQIATDHWMEHLPALARGDLDPYRALWEPALERLRTDRAALAAAARSAHGSAALTAWRSAEPCAPGRHALFAEGGSDRVYVAARAGAGWTHRLVLSTRSWFSLVSAAGPPRPDLAAAARRLDELEGTAASDEVGWRAQDSDSPAPELWFGTEELPWFCEHNPALRPSRLAPEEVATVLRSALAL